MKRRQLLQSIPALAAASLIPSVVLSAEQVLPLPPTLVMSEVRKDPGIPGVLQLEAFWKPYGDETFLVTTPSMRVVPLWWPPSIGHWGPRTPEEFERDFKEGLARNYNESRLFFEKYGVPWIKAANARFQPEPEFYKGTLLRMWVKVRGSWKLCDHGQWTLRKEHTKEELSVAKSARQEWLDSGKTEASAYPTWVA